MAVLLTSCSMGMSKRSFMLTDYTAVANECFEELIAAIQNQDNKGVQSLFSDKTLRETQNIEGAICELFDYYQGELVSYDDWGGANLSGEMNSDGTGRYRTALYSTYDIETTKDKYRFAMEFISMDTAGEDNVGIRSLYIIRLEDDTDPQYAYRGDGKDTPRININKKNSISSGA